MLLEGTFRQRVHPRQVRRTSQQLFELRLHASASRNGTRPNGKWATALPRHFPPELLRRIPTGRRHYGALPPLHRSDCVQITRDQKEKVGQGSQGIFSGAVLHQHSLRRTDGAARNMPHLHHRLRRQFNRTPLHGLPTERH